MKLRDYAELTASSIFTALEMTPTETQHNTVIDLIERRLIATAVDTRNWCADHALERSKIGKAAGHQISDELREATEALITNLSSMR